LKYVEQMRLNPGMSVGQLIEQMGRTGVLGAGKLSSAVNIITEMFVDPDYTVFLALAGPMVPGGLRGVISNLVRNRYVDVIVTNGANIAHDIIEALGHRHLRGTFLANDSKLRAKKLGRIGDIYVKQDAFEALEKSIYRMLEEMQEQLSQGSSIRRILYEFGLRLNDSEAILVNAAKQNIPIFAPGLLDSMIGLHFWTFSQLKKLRIDPLSDMRELADIVLTAKKTGAIILGGGLPKHHVLGVNILREGVDAAVQITLDRPEAGSFSGAPLEEAVSWRKAKTKERLATVIGDATIIFPLIVAAALEKIH
jgi:deoxyhypusine synthase